MIRAYTPTSSDDDLGYFDLVIKVGLRLFHTIMVGVTTGCLRLGLVMHTTLFA